MSSNDHYSLLHDEMLNRLETAGVAIDRYYYLNDARLCWPAATTTAKTAYRSLQELAAVYPYHSLCIFGDSQTFFDPYSFTHFLHGFMFAGMLLLLGRFIVKLNLSTNWRLVIALALEGLWEILENTNSVIERYRAATASLGYRGDTVINSMGDILCCAIGLLIARKLGWLRSLPIFIATEIVLAFWIRDNLVLEIIMLIHPFELIKRWQLGH